MAHQKGSGPLKEAEIMPLLTQKSCSQYPNMVILKFKVPDFDKYKGTTCPKNQGRMCCREMGAYARDEKLLIHF